MFHILIMAYLILLISVVKLQPFFTKLNSGAKDPFIGFVTSLFTGSCVNFTHLVIPVVRRQLP